MSKPDDAREAIRKALDSKFDAELVNQLLENVLAIEKQARGWCPNCKKSVVVSVQDAKAVVSALNDLLIQAKGRPAQAEVEERAGFEFVNKVVLIDG